MATYAENKKVRHEYEILEEYEAGITLSGAEVKSVRSRRVNLEGAFVVIRGGEAFLVGATIQPYQAHNQTDDFDSKRPRKLLLAKKEIAQLIGQEKRKGLTIVPISVYNKGRFIKVRIAVVRGKKKHDKRETIKRRDTERDIARSLKKHFRL